MPSLLALPPELRDEIIQLVVFTTCRPPLSPQKLRHGELEWDQLAVSGTKDGSFYFLDASSVVSQRFPKHGPGPQNTSLGLLLANRQLREKRSACSAPENSRSSWMSWTSTLSIQECG